MVTYGGGELDESLQIYIKIQLNHLLPCLDEVSAVVLDVGTSTTRAG